MSKIITTFSRKFPTHHPRKGVDTFFCEQIYNSIGINYCKQDELLSSLQKWNPSQPDYILIEFIQSLIPFISETDQKHHTIRNGYRAKIGDQIKPCIWLFPGGRFAKGNQMIQFAPLLEIKSIYNFEMDHIGFFSINKRPYLLPEHAAEINQLAKNDGLKMQEFYDWFTTSPGIRNTEFQGQIRVWNKELKY